MAAEPIGPDAAPTGRGSKVSHHRGAGKATRQRNTLVLYYGFGAMGLSRWTPRGGLIVGSRSGDLADAWIAAGKASPQIQWFLDLACDLGPVATLVLVHVDVGLAILREQGISPLDLFKPATAGPEQPPAYEQGFQSQPTDTAAGAAQMPYAPAGPMAPTDTAVPSLVPMTETELRIFPDEGIPAELDILLREESRKPGGRPYSELRQEALVALAQRRMAQNGHTITPGALGAPIAPE